MSDKVAPFDVWRQRVALVELVESTDFLSTAEGAAFIEQLRVLLAPKIIGVARREFKIGYGWLEVDDVVNTALTELRKDHGKVAEYAASSEGEPWGYLYKCMYRWIYQQRNRSTHTLDGLEEIIPHTPILTPDHLTPLEKVVQLTTATLTPYTPQQLHRPLEELVWWLAENPPQRRSYETLEKHDAHEHCPEFTRDQVGAVMNVCWGGRPRQAETSLMGRFLLNPHFRPSDSPTHARALSWYRRQMTAGSSLLTDWN